MEHSRRCAVLIERLHPRNVQNQLPKILAIEKLEQRLGERLNAEHDVFFLYHLPVFRIVGHLGYNDAVAIRVVEHDDTFHAGAVDV